MFTKDYHYNGDFVNNKFEGKGNIELYSEGEYEGGNIPPEDIDKINEKELYLNLRRIHEIDYDIGNENIINDNIVKEIKELFDEYLNDNTHYPFNVKNMLNFYKKQECPIMYFYIKFIKQIFFKFENFLLNEENLL